MIPIFGEIRSCKTCFSFLTSIKPHRSYCSTDFEAHISMNNFNIIPQQSLSLRFPNQTFVFILNYLCTT